MKKTIALLAVFLAVGCKKKQEAAPPAATDKPAPTAPATDQPAPTPTPPTAAAAADFCGKDPCPCQAGSEYKKGDKLSTCQLAKAVVIQGQSCEPGRLRFNDDGSLGECQPTAEVKVGDYTCAKSPSTAAWFPGGKLDNCTLVGAATVGGMALGAGTGVRLYPDGKLHEGWLSATVTVDGFQCQKQLRLFAGGKLMSCALAAAAKVGAQDAPAGSTIRVTEDGKLSGLELGDKAQVAGKGAKAGDRFCFDPTGAPVPGQDCWTF